MEDPAEDAPAADESVPGHITQEVDLTYSKASPRRAGSVVRPRPGGRLPSRRSRVAHEPKKGGALRAVLLTFLVLALAGAGGFWWLKQNRPPPRPVPTGPSAREQAAGLFQMGKNLAREGQWEKAQERFNEAYALDEDLPGLLDYLARSAKEIPNQQHLAAATAALEQAQLGAAATALKKVSADTVQHVPLGKVKQQLDELLAQRMGEAKGLSVRSGDLAGMRKLEAITADVLIAEPENRDAKTLHEQARESIGRLTHKPVAVKGPEGPGPWVQVAERFKAGDLPGAFALANECAEAEVNCRTLVSQLTEFQDLNKRVENLEAKGLERLLQLDSAIGGGSAAATAARTRLATQYYKAAASANQAGQWGRAWDFAAKTLGLDRQHAGAQTIANEVKSRAQNVFMSGYEYASRGENDEALRKFKECAEMSLPSDELHSKCRRRLEQLGP